MGIKLESPFNERVELDPELTHPQDFKSRRAISDVPVFLARILRLPYQIELDKQVRFARERYWEENDPLSIKVGLYCGVDDMPADGWPEKVDVKVIEHILTFLPKDEEGA